MDSRRKSEQGRRDTDPLLVRVKLEDIDRSDERFSMNFEPDLLALCNSAKEVGILEPVWLRAKGRRFQIINGFRRFDVAQRLGMKAVKALVWHEDQIDDRVAFQMGVHENVLARGLNVVEKSLVLDRLLTRFSFNCREVVRKWLPLLDLEPSEKILKGFLLISAFSIGTKRYLLDHGVSLKNALLLAAFPEAERRSICGFLWDLRIGENVLREILTYLREIARREGTRVEDLLSNRKIQRILSDESLSGPQRTQAIRRFLRERRYPRLSDLEKRFSSYRKGMGLPPQVKITPPAFFEGDQFKIEFSFRSLKEYEDLLGTLEKLEKERIGSLLMIKGYGREPL